MLFQKQSKIIDRVLGNLTKNLFLMKQILKKVCRKAFGVYKAQVILALLTVTI
jgi:hypothetical protein